MNVARTRHFSPTANGFKSDNSCTQKTTSLRKSIHASTFLSEIGNTWKSTINVLENGTYSLGNFSLFCPRHFFSTASNASSKQHRDLPERQNNEDESLVGLEKNTEKAETVCQTLTHVNKSGQVNMVDVGGKTETRRHSVARGTVKLGEAAFALVKDNKMKKGDVLSVAKLAGIMAAKQTSNLIPLCHNISLTNIKVELILEEETFTVGIVARVECVGKTGVEMEALTAVSVAALTVYDMCKSVSKNIVIRDVYLEGKDGGKSGLFVRETM